MGFFGNLGNAVSSTVSAVGDVAENVVDSAVDTATDAIDTGIDWAQGGIHFGQGWLCREVGTVACEAGNIFGGLLDGSLAAFQDSIDKTAIVIRDAARLGGSTLRLDLAGFLRASVDFGLDSLNAGAVGVRFGSFGYFVGGIVDAYERDELRNFVSDLVNEHFTGEQLGRVRQRIGLDGGQFGLPLDGLSRVLVLDSDKLPLAQWHRAGLLDLYAMAGLFSTDSFSSSRARTVVKIVGPDGHDSALPVGRLQISRFLEADGQGWRFRVYALSRQARAAHLATATDKCQQLGLRIRWNDGTRFAWFRSYTSYEVADEQEYRMSFRTPSEISTTPSDVGQWMHDAQDRQGTPAEDCTILALGSFSTPIFDLGITVSRDIDEGAASTPCGTPQRTDGCCNVIERVREDDASVAVGSGVIYKDAWPQIIFAYVLAHEIGHYVGLCHFGHDGAQNIMYTKEHQDPPLRDLRPVTPGTFWGYYRDSEPRFSLDDAKNCWRFLVNQMPHCLAPDTEPVPVE
jgi:hypothetical protein